MKEDETYEKESLKDQLWEWKIIDEAHKEDWSRTLSLMIEACQKKMLKHILKTVRNIEIQNENFFDDCEICTCTQKIKVQNHEAVKLRVAVGRVPAKMGTYNVSNVGWVVPN